MSIRYKKLRKRENLALCGWKNDDRSADLTGYSRRKTKRWTLHPLRQRTVFTYIRRVWYTPGICALSGFRYRLRHVKGNRRCDCDGDWNCNCNDYSDPDPDSDQDKPVRLNQNVSCCFSGSAGSFMVFLMSPPWVAQKKPVVSRFCCSAECVAFFPAGSLRGVQKLPGAEFRHSALRQDASVIRGISIFFFPSHHIGC